MPGRWTSVARWRWQVAARLLTAIIAGYALTALASATLAVVALALSMPRVDAALTGMLASFAIYCGVILCSFGAPTLGRLWRVLMASAVLLWIARSLALALY